MNSWWPWVMMLGGVNLTRMRGHGWLWGLLAALGTLAWKAFGGAPGAGWLAWIVGAATAGAVPMLWGLWALSGRQGRTGLGLAAGVAGVAALIGLIPPLRPAPVAAGPWLAALLLLAEPANRLLRWSLGLVGKPVTGGAAGVVADLGRGEAIGVLERWIALVMVARGDYAALGFLMAAKALARHKRFEDDPAFAEYFLVGTLGSVLAAIAVGEGLAYWTRIP